jgi:hypothetical protein
VDDANNATDSSDVNKKPAAIPNKKAIISDDSKTPTLSVGFKAYGLDEGRL